MGSTRYTLYMGTRNESVGIALVVVGGTLAVGFHNLLDDFPGWIRWGGSAWLFFFIVAFFHHPDGPALLTRHNFVMALSVSAFFSLLFAGYARIDEVHAVIGPTWTWILCIALPILAGLCAWAGGRAARSLNHPPYPHRPVEAAKPWTISRRR